MSLARFVESPKQNRWSHEGLHASMIYKIPNTVSSRQLKPHNLEQIDDKQEGVWYKGIFE